MPTFRTSDGVDLCYTDEGGGSPVVLVAGYTAPAESWALTSEALLAADHRVIAFDRRSHGASDTPDWGQRISRHGKDIAELLEALDLDDVTIVGASMGASSCWAYLDLFAGQHLRAMVGVDQTPKMINTADWPYGFYGLEPGNAGVFFEEGIPDTGRGRAAELSLPNLQRLFERIGGPFIPRDPQAPETTRLLYDHAQQDWRDVIDRSPVPMLLVAGRDSQLWSSDHASAAAERNPLVRAVRIDDCGHNVQLDQPELFNRVLIDFLAESGPSGQGSR